MKRITLLYIAVILLASCSSQTSPTLQPDTRFWEVLEIFLRDWLPSVAIIVAGIWKIFEYAKNREKEMPAIEGELRTSSIPIGALRLVELDVLWKNRSPRPLKLNTQKCQIDVYSLSNLELGFLDTNALPTLEYVNKPFESLAGMLLEPNTDSHLKAFFVIPPGKLYLVRWTLYQNKINGYEWSKESVIDLR